MTNEDLISIGFKPMPHYTVANSVVYDLGRDRQLSAGCVGTPNETLFIMELKEEGDNMMVCDLVCLHNYDYDGYMTIEKVKGLISLITNKKFTENEQ